MGASSFLFRRLWRSFPALRARAHIAWFPVGGCAQDCMWIFRKPQNTPKDKKGLPVILHESHSLARYYARAHFRAPSASAGLPAWEFRVHGAHGKQGKRRAGEILCLFCPFVPSSLMSRRSSITNRKRAKRTNRKP